MDGNQKMETLCGLSGQVKEREFRTITNVVHVLFVISPHYGTGIGWPFRRPFHILSRSAFSARLFRRPQP
jgi:hypothetical protein